jgi:hypothetical protein
MVGVGRGADRIDEICGWGVSSGDAGPRALPAWLDHRKSIGSRTIPARTGLSSM